MASKKTACKMKREESIVRTAELIRTRPGITTRELGRELGCHHATAAKYIIEIERQWKAQYAGDRHTAKMRQLARLHYMWREAHDAWQKSKKTKQIITKETEENEACKEIDASTGKKVPAKKHKARIRIEEPAGDPRFLAEMRQIEDQISKLMGTAAPIEVEHSGPDGAPIPVAAAMKQISTDDLRSFIMRVSNGDTEGPVEAQLIEQDTEERTD